jgi:hypothetical protein
MGWLLRQRAGMDLKKKKKKSGFADAFFRYLPSAERDARKKGCKSANIK